jgi:hypothetical protein
MAAMRSLVLAVALGTSGCGATTVRVELAPSFDTGGRPGFESTLALGVGLPLDFHGRSHHFIQARAALGGGYDGESRGGVLVTAADVDYIHWAEPHMDVRAGLRLSYRSTSDAKLYGLGARLGLLPIVLHHDGGWLVSHLCVGPELRFEHLWSDQGTTRGLFSLPLVLEGNFLGAGD